MEDEDEEEEARAAVLVVALWHPLLYSTLSLVPYIVVRSL